MIPWQLVLVLMLGAVYFITLVGVSITQASENNNQLRCVNERKVTSEITETIIMAGRVHGVDPCLITAVIEAESSFREKAVSSRGAKGLMQLMPRTARDLGVRQIFDPVQNILGGTGYLRQMHDHFGTWRSALIAYNWGPGNLTRYGPDIMPNETRDYLTRVERYYGKDLDSK